LKDVVTAQSMGRQFCFHVKVFNDIGIGNYWEAYRRFKRGRLNRVGSLHFKNRDGPVLYSMFSVLLICFRRLLALGKDIGL
jgi:hypothetical protein